jgi:hypothetical protein
MPANGRWDLIRRLKIKDDLEKRRPCSNTVDDRLKLGHRKLLTPAFESFAFGSLVTIL